MCGCATLTIRRELPSTHVHPDRESIVRRDSPRHEEIFSAKRLHVLSLAQDEALEHGVRHLHFEVDSIDLGIPERAEVKSNCVNRVAPGISSSISSRSSRLSASTGVSPVSTAPPKQPQCAG